MPSTAPGKRTPARQPRSARQAAGGSGAWSDVRLRSSLAVSSSSHPLVTEQTGDRPEGDRRDEDGRDDDQHGHGRRAADIESLEADLVNVIGQVRRSGAGTTSGDDVNPVKGLYDVDGSEQDAELDVRAELGQRQRAEYPQGAGPVDPCGLQDVI